MYRGKFAMGEKYIGVDIDLDNATPEETLELLHEGELALVISGDTLAEMLGINTEAAYEYIGIVKYIFGGITGYANREGTAIEILLPDIRSGLSAKAEIDRMDEEVGKYGPKPRR